MKSMSLRARMIVGGMLIVIIPLIVVGIATFYYVSNSLEKITREKSTLVAESLASLVQASLEGELKIISTLAVDPRIAEAVSTGNYSGALNTKIKKTFEKFSVYLEGAFIADKAGVIRMDAVDAKRHGLDLGDREYFLKAKAGKATISDPVFSKVTGNPIVIISAPIIANNEFVGVIAGALKIDYLLNHISSIKLGKTGYPYYDQPERDHNYSSAKRVPT